MRHDEAPPRTQQPGADPKISPITFQFVLSAVTNLERMLLESSFINSLYVGWDKCRPRPPGHARGGRRSDRSRSTGVPQPTSQMQEYKDDDGNIKMGYQTRNWFDAQIHALTENRATAALIGQLVTGLRATSCVPVRWRRPVPSRSHGRTLLKQKRSSAPSGRVCRPEADPWVREPVHQHGCARRFKPHSSRKINAESKAMRLNEYKSTRRLNEIWYGLGTNRTSGAYTTSSSQRETWKAGWATRSRPSTTSSTPRM